MGAQAVAAAAPAPSVCAGLQQVLQQGWRAAFPLRGAPWPEMAAAVGATGRELLLRAQQLQRAQQLLPVQVRWGEALRRHRWRLGFAGLSTAARQTLLRQAAQLPALLCIEWVEELADRSAVQAWLHLEARELAALEQTREQLQAALDQTAQACWLLQRPSDPCACAATGGPCEDARLAQLLEQQGLPLVAHPFAVLASHLGDRNERALLGRLRDWQRSGWLQRLALTPPFVPREQRWRSWVMPASRTAELLPGGAEHPGSRLHSWTDAASGERGWLLSLTGDAAPPPLPVAPRAQWRSRVLRLRPQALLFA